MYSKIVSKSCYRTFIDILYCLKTNNYIALKIVANVWLGVTDDYKETAHATIRTRDVKYPKQII